MCSFVSIIMTHNMNLWLNQFTSGNKQPTLAETLWYRSTKPCGTAQPNLVVPLNQTMWYRSTKPCGTANQTLWYRQPNLVVPLNQTMWYRSTINLVVPLNQTGIDEFGFKGVSAIFQLLKGIQGVSCEEFSMLFVVTLGEGLMWWSVRLDVHKPV